MPRPWSREDESGQSYEVREALKAEAAAVKAFNVKAMDK